MNNRYPPRGFFVCECDDFRCAEPLPITVAQYNALKRTEYLLSKQCSSPVQTEHIVADNTTYLVMDRSPMELR